jgi:flagellar hook-basal body complex protein FliE
MNDIGINEVLAQMRAMRLQAQGGSGAMQPSTVKPAGAEFTSVLQRSINAVNGEQQKAQSLAQAFEAGDSKVELAEVMVQMQKANLSFQAMTQVRNKLVQAYQEIMGMSI